MKVLFQILQVQLHLLESRLLWKRQAARQTREEQRKLNESLVMRVATFESRLEPTAQVLLAEWDAIAGGAATPEQKMLALRALYLAVVERHARTDRSPSVSGSL